MYLLCLTRFFHAHNVIWPWCALTNCKVRLPPRGLYVVCAVCNERRACAAISCRWGVQAGQEPTPGTMATDNKYDRQLRLWGSHGQVRTCVGCVVSSK